MITKDAIKKRKRGESRGAMEEKLNSGYFRMMILGSSGSGKTHLLLYKLLPLLKRTYSTYVIFTRQFNANQYVKAFKKLGPRLGEEIEPIIYTDTSTILPRIETIKELQEENISHYDRDGIPVYGDNILFIFDDVLKENMFKSDAFLEVFVNLRHLQISTIMLSQITNKAISTQMKANTTYFILLRLNGYYQRQFPISLISECVEKLEPGLSPKKANEKARKIYGEHCINTQYGYLIVDEFSDMA